MELTLVINENIRVKGLPVRGGGMGTGTGQSGFVSGPKYSISGSWRCPECGYVVDFVSRKMVFAGNEPPSVIAHMLVTSISQGADLSDEPSELAKSFAKVAEHLWVEHTRSIVPVDLGELNRMAVDKARAEHEAAANNRAKNEARQREIETMPVEADPRIAAMEKQIDEQRDQFNQLMELLANKEKVNEIRVDARDVSGDGADDQGPTEAERVPEPASDAPNDGSSEDENTPDGETV